MLSIVNSTIREYVLSDLLSVSIAVVLFIKSLFIILFVILC